VLSLKRSLHRKPTEALAFYGVFFELILLSSALVLARGTPLGLLTNAVQTLAGVLLPSATVFLLLLVMLSIVLTAAMLCPGITEPQIMALLAADTVIALGAAAGAFAVNRRTATPRRETRHHNRDTWRMPSLRELPPRRLTILGRIWMFVLRAYLLVAGGLVLLRIIQLAVV
jgi:Mn2+/Fe2+ NRAMP family transporter